MRKLGDMMRVGARRRLALMTGALVVGCMFQMASCADLTAQAVTGLLSSISYQVIRNSVYEVLGLSPGLFMF